MRRRRLLWQLYLPTLAIVALALLALTYLGTRTLDRFGMQRSRVELEARTTLAIRILEDAITRNDAATIDAVVKQLGPATESRLTVIAADGRVLGDSDQDPAVMDNHGTRPEVLEALRQGTGSATRYSDTTHEEMVYVAARLNGGAAGTPSAIVRTSLSTAAIEAAIRGFYLRIAGGGLIVATLAALVSLIVSRRITKPLVDLEKAASRYADGDLSVRIPASGSEETASLAAAMNQMAAHLDERIRSVVRQRNEQDAVLSSMIEGVIAVDRDERVITLNKAAGRLLDVEPYAVLGRSIQEVARNAELQQFVTHTLGSAAAVERDLTMHGADVRHIQAHGAPIRDVHGQRIGAVIVLNDVTQMRRLENLRRDFVANVSHELKTPITSIKGFVETLRDGAMDDREDAERFLEIVSRHADRLSSIIEDLLSLSRIEQEADEGALAVASEPVRELLARAIEVCKVKAAARRVQMRITCEASNKARVNAPLLEQAVVNLVDNAIKYSDDGGIVEVSAATSDGAVDIRVRDHGCGIEPRHLTRLFERFYRVDKARSRKLGGTGLGLAIVKHIAHAHGGSVHVQSIPGRGEQFYHPLAGREC